MSPGQSCKHAATEPPGQPCVGGVGLVGDGVGRGPVGAGVGAIVGVEVGAGAHRVGSGP